MDVITHSITQNQPTFDITNITFLGADEQCVYFEMKEAIQFDTVYAHLGNRSRVVRQGKQECELVLHVVGAVIDAGFIGRLRWKIVLTKAGKEFISTHSTQEIEQAFSGCAQLCFYSCPTNYYNGTNQTNLNPEIVFTQ